MTFVNRTTFSYATCLIIILLLPLFIRKQTFRCCFAKIKTNPIIRRILYYFHRLINGKMQIKIGLRSFQRQNDIIFTKFQTINMICCFNKICHYIFILSHIKSTQFMILFSIILHDISFIVFSDKSKIKFEISYSYIFLFWWRIGLSVRMRINSQKRSYEKRNWNEVSDDRIGARVHGMSLWASLTSMAVTDVRSARYDSLTRLPADFSNRERLRLWQAIYPTTCILANERLFFFFLFSIYCPYSCLLLLFPVHFILLSTIVVGFFLSRTFW